MARPKKTAAELKMSGARAGRIKARPAEEKPQPPAPVSTEPDEIELDLQALALFIAATTKNTSRF